MTTDDKYAYRLITSSDLSKVPGDSGIISYSDIDNEDGYFHMSTKQQALTTAQKYFANVHDLYVLKVNLSSLDQDKLKWEIVTTRNNELFPHYYDHLNIKTHVVNTRLLPVDEQGQHYWPTDL